MFRKIIFPFLFLLSPALKDKIKLLWLILRYDWRIIPYPSSNPGAFDGVAEDELLEKFKNLDPGSIQAGRLFLQMQQRNPAEYQMALCNRSIYCPKAARKLEWPISNEVLSTIKEKHIPAAWGDVSTLYFHNGLRLLAPEALEYIKNTVFIDAGAACGDSALMLMKYAPESVFSFEPSPSNASLYRKLMCLNAVPEGKYRLFELGLSSESGLIRFQDSSSGNNTLCGGTAVNAEAEITTLDAVLEKFPGRRIGFIKADLEGMGLKMLCGAEKTIRAYRPVLALSIYHNSEEFFGIYQTLAAWNLAYDFRIVSLDPVVHFEITLLAVPKELSGKERINLLGMLR